MGSNTDALTQTSPNPTPPRRELDILPDRRAGQRSTSGHRVGSPCIKAISLTGSQSGILTDSVHTNARIRDIRPVRLWALTLMSSPYLSRVQGLILKQRKSPRLGGRLRLDSSRVDACAWRRYV